MTEWAHITNPEQHGGLLPAWFISRMIGARGAFGLLLTTGDVLRVTEIAAAHVSDSGVILADVLLDGAGVPDGVDTAWRTKHFLGAPVPGATLATVNLSQVVAAIEFAAAELVEQPNPISALAGAELEPDRPVPVVRAGGVDAA